MRFLLLSIILLTAVFLLATSAASTQPLTYHDSFRIVIEEEGNIAPPDSSGGSGYDGNDDGEGDWYQYQSGWSSQWYYNGPFDSNNGCRVWGFFETDILIILDDPIVVLYSSFTSLLPPYNPPGNYLEMAVNWATPAWEATGIEGPPLPEHCSTPELEDLYINRIAIEEFDPPDWPGFWPLDDRPDMWAGGPPRYFYAIIPDYNPEWISIDIMGSYTTPYGSFDHQMIPEPATTTLLAVGLLGVLLRKRS